MARRWTQEEIDYLEQKWGSISIATIAKKLGRSQNAIKLKAHRLGLGDPLTHIDGITISQLSQLLNTNYAIIKNWIEKYGMPAKQKIVACEQKVWVISYEKFWEWAEQNKQMIDFSKLQRLALGPEPDWVEEKRRADHIKKLHTPRPHNTPWTKDEEAKLKWMLDQHKYTYAEIAAELRRSQAAVKRKIWELGLKARPISLDNHIKYTEQEIKLLLYMINQGYSVDVIAERLNKSALGVREKIRRMGYKFMNGVPKKIS